MNRGKAGDLQSVAPLAAVQDRLRIVDPDPPGITAGSIDGMFDFSQTPQPALFLNSVTGEPEATPPPPQLPESSFPGALVATGGVVLGGAALWQVRRRRKKAAAV